MHLLAAVGAALIGIAVPGAMGAWTFAPVVGWILAATMFLVLTWAGVGRLDADATAAHVAPATASGAGRRHSLVHGG